MENKEMEKVHKKVNKASFSAISSKIHCRGQKRLKDR